MENIDFKEQLIEAIMESFKSYREKGDELAFLALQGKIENLLRDKIAWLIEDKLKEEAFVRKEYHPSQEIKHCPPEEDIPTRTKCDLAILDKDKKTPKCLVEFKAAFWGEHAKSEYLDCCKSDCDKMRKFSNVVGEQKIPKYYIFFQIYHRGEESNIDDNKSLISYSDILKTGKTGINIEKGKRNCIDPTECNKDNNPWRDIDVKDGKNKYTDNGDIVAVLNQNIGKYYELEVGIVTMILKVKDEAN